jgi:hypothetical protein
MPKTPAKITPLTRRSDGPIDALSSPARGVQAAQSATDVAQQAIVRGRPVDVREQTGISTPCNPVAPHSGRIPDPRGVKPRKLPMNRPMVSPSKG